MSVETKTLDQTEVDEITSSPYKIVLHNDDFNSFDWVITCLVKICGHETEQANQCAMIVHYKGKCDVKLGDKETLTKMKDKLKAAGLIATMEAN